MKLAQRHHLHASLLGCALLALGCRSTESDTPFPAVWVDPNRPSSPPPGPDAGHTHLPGCDEGYTFVPSRESCVQLDACEQDNGGCGDPNRTQCLSDADGSVVCEDIDECQRADPCGGYACFNRVSAPPLCESECPAGSVDWTGDNSLCVAAVKSFFSAPGRGCALLHDGRVRCVRGTEGPFPTEERFVAIHEDGGTVCGVRTDGSAACTGNLAALPLSQLGGGLTKVVPGHTFACGLAYGRVQCVGTLAEGALPFPSTQNYDNIDLHARGARGCAVTRRHSLRCWGADPSGTLAALQTQKEESFAGVSLGVQHGCALRTDSSLHCWSEHVATAPPFTDARVSGPNEDPQQDFTQVSAGVRHTCALRRDGRATCWGAEIFDEVSGPGQWEGEAIERVEAMDTATCAFFASGRFQCWGAGISYGFSHIVPAMAPRATHYAQYGCLRQEDGRLRCEADKSRTDARIRIKPLAAELFSDGARIRAVGGDNVFGSYHRVCTLSSDGSMHCNAYSFDYATWLYGPVEAPFPELEVWGRSNFVRMFYTPSGVCGLDGNGNLACYSIPSYPVPYFSNAASYYTRYLDLAHSGEHVCGLQTTGRLVCWTSDPTASWAAGPNASPRTDYVDVEVASGATCALRRGGEVECWGSDQGALDQLSKLERQSFIQLAVTTRSVCGRREDGSITCAGRPDIGQPIAMEHAGPFVDVWVQERDNVCALTTEGALHCWGPYPYDGEALVVTRRRAAD